VAYQRGAKLHFIRPGKPVENAYCESFNGKLRNECLNENWFLDLDDREANHRSVAGRLQRGPSA
jgi:transposase InsO family protein